MRRLLSSGRGFDTQKESSFSYDPRRGLYRYDVRSSLDVKNQGGSMRLLMDGGSGALVLLWLPTGAATGDTVTTWLTDLHWAEIGAKPVKAVMTLLGIAIALLSITGVAIWLRKRRASEACPRINRGQALMRAATAGYASRRQPWGHRRRDTSFTARPNHGPLPAWRYACPASRPTASCASTTLAMVMDGKIVA